MKRPAIIRTGRGQKIWNQENVCGMCPTHVGTLSSSARDACKGNMRLKGDQEGENLTSWSAVEYRYAREKEVPNSLQSFGSQNY
jgi:hypothetical protein